MANINVSRPDLQEVRVEAGLKFSASWFQICDAEKLNAASSCLVLTLGIVSSSSIMNCPDPSDGLDSWWWRSRLEIFSGPKPSSASSGFQSTCSVLLHNHDHMVVSLWMGRLHNHGKIFYYFPQSEPDEGRCWTEEVQEWSLGELHMTFLCVQKGNNQLT